MGKVNREQREAEVRAETNKYYAKIGEVVHPPPIMDVVNANVQVFLHQYRNGLLYYRIWYHGGWWVFPVPVVEVTTSTMKEVEGAWTLREWIQRSVKAGTFVETEEADLETPAFALSGRLDEAIGCKITDIDVTYDDYPQLTLLLDNSQQIEIVICQGGNQIDVNYD